MRASLPDRCGTSLSLVTHVGCKTVLEEARSRPHSMAGVMRVFDDIATFSHLPTPGRHPTRLFLNWKTTWIGVGPCMGFSTKRRKFLVLNALRRGSPRGPVLGQEGGEWDLLSPGFQKEARTNPESGSLGGAPCLSKSSIAKGPGCRTEGEVR